MALKNSCNLSLNPIFDSSSSSYQQVILDTGSPSIYLKRQSRLTGLSWHNGDANNRDYGKVDVDGGFVQLTANDDTGRARRRGVRCACAAALSVNRSHKVHKQRRNLVLGKQKK
ncbi:jg19654 [Pararge aegeria aegeria]|uniref:Jg19654 protein n=1 Tax=Pararge aegeria aegeria TaxID=348720 RepID=A0A8S4S4W2_9NEOP|nr:jg19654 [Pararge aegeria aegeria]